MAILKSQRHTKRGLESRTAPHILHGAENEAVRIIQGSPDLLSQFAVWADERGCKFAAREFIFSPSEPISDVGLEWTNTLIGAEFGYDPGRTLIVEHRKRRRRIGGVAHYHIIVPEFDPERGGGVLDSRHSYPRQEKLARIIERHFGHAMTSGAHNVSVAYAVEAEHPELAKNLRAVQPARRAGEPPTSYSPAEAAASKRAGVHAGDVAEAVRDAWAVSESGEAFQDRLSEMGLRVAPGSERPGVICVWHGERVLRPLYRILKGVKNVEVRTFLATTDAVIARVPSLPAADVNEVFAAEREKLRTIVDTSDLERVRENRGAASQIVKQSEKDAQRWEAEATAIRGKMKTAEHRLRKLGWLKRLFSPRCRAEFAAVSKSLARMREKIAYADLNAKQNRDNIVGFSADETILAKREAGIRADLRRQEDRNQKAFDDRSLMLDRIRDMALEADMRFYDREELVAFIEACRAEEEDARLTPDEAPYMLRPGFKASIPTGMR